MKKGLLFIGAGVVIFLFGYVVAILVCYEQFSLLDSSPKAMIVMRELELARSGKLDDLIEIKEIELNTLMYEHAMFLKEGKPWLIWPLSVGYDHTKYMEPATFYKKKYPYIIEEEVDDASTYQEIAEAIDYVSDHYSEVAHNKSLKSETPHSGAPWLNR